MVTVKPMDNPLDPNNPDANTNDFVIDQNMNPLYNGQPLDVLNWLNTPGNMGDTTQVVISRNGNAVSPWSGTYQYASLYVEAFYSIYPDLQTS